MKWIAFAAALAGTAALVPPTPVHAAGCIKGAIVGGIAGHYAGNHGLLGAGAGCLIGHHMAQRSYYGPHRYHSVVRHY